MHGTSDPGIEPPPPGGERQRRPPPAGRVAAAGDCSPPGNPRRLPLPRIAEARPENADPRADRLILA